MESLADEISNLYRNPNRHPPRIQGLIADASLPTCLEVIADAVENCFGGRLDIYINNAAPRIMTAIGSLDSEHIQKFCLANIQTPALVVDEFVKRKMFRKDSRIVFVSYARG